MGIFYQEIGLLSQDGAQTAAVTARVDTGSVYTFVPAPTLEGLGLAPKWTTHFELPDGRQVEYGLAEVRIRLGGLERTNVCIFGPPDCEPRIGHSSLQSFGLAADRVNKRLVPDRMFL